MKRILKRELGFLIMDILAIIIAVIALAIKGELLSVDWWIWPLAAVFALLVHFTFRLVVDIIYSACQKLLNPFEWKKQTITKRILEEEQ
jgi:hypothetical protein